MQPTSPLPSPQFRMEIDFASNLVAEATLWECDFLSHHNSRYRKFYFSKLIATTIHPTINNSFLNMYFYLYLGYAIVFSLKIFHNISLKSFIIELKSDIMCFITWICHKTKVCDTLTKSFSLIGNYFDGHF
jgi:hypothetical protein